MEVTKQVAFLHLSLLPRPKKRGWVGRRTGSEGKSRLEIGPTLTEGGEWWPKEEGRLLTTTNVLEQNDMQCGEDK